MKHICVQQRALGASVAALGLSNKAVYEDDVLNGPSAEPTGSVANYTEVNSSPRLSFCLFGEALVWSVSPLFSCFARERSQ